MNNGWTGGQYSILRVLFGLFLLVRFAHYLLASSASEVSGADMLIAAIAATLCLPLALGFHDRLAAALLLTAWLYLFGRWSLEPAGLLLVAHMLLPAAPYGSWAARGRVDPGGNWHMPAALFAATWFMLTAAYTLRCYIRLASAFADEIPLNLPMWMLELAFAPMALHAPFRPWIWTIMFAIQAVQLNGAMMLLHLFAFDPAWIRPLRASGEMIFYDGQCGLCHRSVRWVLAEDADAFRFAPLDSDKFRETVPEALRAGLPDSLVVRTADGAILTRSAGVTHILRRLGGVWRLVAMFTMLVPTAILDRLYDGLAHVRYRLFAKPAGVCPMMPPALRARFDL